jgi:Domain of unknown function (DUF4388)
MSVGLSGKLEDFGIADVFQLIGQQRKTGILELKGGSGRVQLVFDHGMVVSAAPITARATDADPLGEMLVRCGLLTRERCDEANAACRSSAQTVGRRAVERGWLRAEDVAHIEELLTRDTIFEILRWKQGSFDFRAQDVTHDREPGSLLGAEQILMDGLRMVDEWNSIEAFVPSPDTVFRRVGLFAAYRADAGSASPSQIENTERVFSLIDARLSARRVIDLSRLGTFEGSRALAELARTSVIKQLDPEGVRQLRRHLRPAGSLAASVRRWGVALLPLALLAATVVATRDQAAAGPAPAPSGVYTIEGTHLADLREAYTTQRLRRLSEVYRLAEGHWPSRLADLEASGLIDAGALAPSASRSYYSFNRDGGFLLLAPEH